MCLLLTCVCVCAVCATQGAIAAVERRHADELREELQDTRDLCAFYQQENEELNMVSLLYQRQLEVLKQRAAPTPAPGEGVCLWHASGGGWLGVRGRPAARGTAFRFACTSSGYVAIVCCPDSVCVCLLCLSACSAVLVCAAAAAPYPMFLCRCCHALLNVCMCVVQPQTGTMAGSGCQQPVSSGQSAAAGTATGTGSRCLRATRAQACGIELLRGLGTAGW